MHSVQSPQTSSRCSSRYFSMHIFIRSKRSEYIVLKRLATSGTLGSQIGQGRTAPPRVHRIVPCQQYRTEPVPGACVSSVNVSLQRTSRRRRTSGKVRRRDITRSNELQPFTSAWHFRRYRLGATRATERQDGISPSAPRRSNTRVSSPIVFINFEYGFPGRGDAAATVSPSSGI